MGVTVRKSPQKQTRSRKWYIMNPGQTCLFIVSANSQASGAEPIYELAAFSEVSRHTALIGRAANKTGVEARLISAIMYVETTHGYYDAPLAWFSLNKSLLPMNINVDYWGSTFGDRDTLSTPAANILAGATLIQRIQSHLPAGAPVSHVATLYNNINAERVSDYGKRVEAVYKSEPWKKAGHTQ